MNTYKKLFFVLALSAHSLHFYANTEIPAQEKEIEKYLIDLAEEINSDANFKTIIDINIQQITHQSEQLKFKYHVLSQHRELLTAIQDYQTCLQSNSDNQQKAIQEFIPRFAQYKHLLAQPETNEDIEEEQQSNPIQKEQQPENNLGNWIRNHLAEKDQTKFLKQQEMQRIHQERQAAKFASKK